MESYNNFVHNQINATIQMFNPVTIKSEHNKDEETGLYTLQIIDTIKFLTTDFVAVRNDTTVTADVLTAALKQDYASWALRNLVTMALRHLGTSASKHLGTRR